MSVYIYGRVSHRNSGASGLSEASQYLECKRYIESVLSDVPIGQSSYPEGNVQGYFFDRAVSAWKSAFTDREGACALTKILKPGDHVVFYNIERGFRSTIAFCQMMEHWEKSGIRAHFVSEGINFDTPEGKLLGRTLAVFAEYYSDLLSARTKEAARIKKLGLLEPHLKREKTKWSESDFRFIPKDSQLAIPAKHGRIFTYARCSHLDSELSGLGMAAQLDGVDRMAQRLVDMGMVRYPEHFRDDSISAFRTPFHKRPAGARIMELAQPGDVLLVYRTDRIFRSPGDAAKIVTELNARQVAIHIVQGGIDTSTQMGQMFIQTLTLFAYIESSVKSKKSKEISAYLKSQGRPPCKYPRYAKVIVDKQGIKRLAYDYEKIVMQAATYICRAVYEMSELDTCDILHAIYCAKHHITPKPHGWRSAKAWNRNNVWRSMRDFEGLRSVLPPEAINDCMLIAADILTQDIPPIFKKQIRRAPFPLKDAQSRIVDHLISV